MKKMNMVEVYDSLSAINRSFDQIVRELDALRRHDGFRTYPIRSVVLAAEETRAWAVFEILETLHEREQREWTRLGSARTMREKRLEQPGRPKATSIPRRRTSKLARQP